MDRHWIYFGFIAPRAWVMGIRPAQDPALVEVLEYHGEAPPEHFLLWDDGLFDRLMRHALRGDAVVVDGTETHSAEHCEAVRRLAELATEWEVLS